MFNSFRDYNRSLNLENIPKIRIAETNVRAILEDKRVKYPENIKIENNTVCLFLQSILFKTSNIHMIVHEYEKGKFKPLYGYKEVKGIIDFIEKDSKVSNLPQFTNDIRNKKWSQINIGFRELILNSPATFVVIPHDNDKALTKKMISNLNSIMKKQIEMAGK